MGTEQALKCFVTKIDDVFISDQPIVISHDGVRFVLEARVDRYDRPIAFRASGPAADIYVR